MFVSYQTSQTLSKVLVCMYDLNNGCLTLDCLHLPVIQEAGRALGIVHPGGAYHCIAVGTEASIV
jgi:hypothetical protein